MDASDDAEGEEETADVCPKEEPRSRTDSLSSLPGLAQSGESSQTSSQSSVSEEGNSTGTRVNHCWPLRASGESRWDGARCLLRELPIHHAIYFIGRSAGLVTTDVMKILSFLPSNEESSFQLWYCVIT